MMDVGSLLEKTKNLPVFSDIIPRLAMLVSKPDSNLSDIVKIISFDQAMTGNVLKWANSSLWGTNRPIVDVKDAVIRLGAGRILEIAIGRTVKGVMEEECPQYGLVQGELWKHAAVSALAAEESQNFVTPILPSECFTAALLHDIGKLVAAQYIEPDSLFRILEMSNSEGVSYMEAEEEVLGITHTQIGWHISKLWNFPDSIGKAILYHHKPDECENIVVDVVHISNLVAKTLGVGLGHEALNLFGSKSAADRLRLSWDGFESLCAVVLARIPEIEEFYLTN